MACGNWGRTTDSHRLFATGGADHLDGFCRRVDRCFLKAFHSQQIPIPRDDEISLRRDGAGDHLIVIGIGGHDARHAVGLDDLDDGQVIGDDFVRGLVDGRQLLGR